MSFLLEALRDNNLELRSTCGNLNVLNVLEIHHIATGLILGGKTVTSPLLELITTCPTREGPINELLFTIVARAKQDLQSNELAVCSREVLVDIVIEVHIEKLPRSVLPSWLN